MGDKKLQRKDFLKSLIGAKNKTDIATDSNNDFVEKEQNQNDPLFDKYARKELNARHYSNQIEFPDMNGSFGARIGNVTSGLTQYAGAWTISEVSHLLKRTSFGIKKGDLDGLLSLDVSSAVDSLLSFSNPVLPTPTPINWYQNSEIDSSGVTLGGNWTNKNLTYQPNSNDGTVDYYRCLGLQYWNWGLCIDDNTSIREKMTLFWYHFIPIDYEGLRNIVGNAATLSNDYMKLLRANCLGNFKLLIKAITKSPAMLFYLSGQYSTAAAPNENFARELMELFMLGKVPTQNYTEDDVQAAAKIFSGWAVNYYSLAYYPFVVEFTASNHNQSNKTFSSFFGNTVINNQAGAAGAAELDLFFDMMFLQQSTTIAKYICRRLYRFFVYYDIDANVETNVIQPLSALLISSNWDMQPVLSALLSSEHFFDAVNKGVMIKSPIDFISGLLRTLKVNTSVPNGASQINNQYAVWGYLQHASLNYLEQGFGTVPNVSGWKAYYQNPTYYQNWINSNTIQQRSELVRLLINGGLSPGGLNLKIDPIVFVQQFPNATIQNPDLLINIIIQYLFSVDLPQTFKTETKIQNLLSGQTTNYYWTSAWNNYNNNQTNIGYKNIVTDRLTALLTSFLQLAEFQLM